MKMSKIDVEIDGKIIKHLGFENQEDFIWSQINNDLKSYGFEDGIKPCQEKIPNSIRYDIAKIWNEIYLNPDKPNIITKGGSVLIEGPVGSGKTMAAKMIVWAARSIVEYRNKPVIRIFRAEEIIPKSDFYYENDSYVKNLKVLVIDDLSSMPYHQFQINYIQSLLTYRIEQKLCTIITTNSLNDKIFDVRLVDRMNRMYKVLTIKEKSQRVEDLWN